jgi:hypothetical protein
MWRGEGKGGSNDDMEDRNVNDKKNDDKGDG